jgi:hypothetical protein
MIENGVLKKYNFDGKDKSQQFIKQKNLPINLIRRFDLTLNFVNYLKVQFHLPHIYLNKLICHRIVLIP